MGWWGWSWMCMKGRMRYTAELGLGERIVFQVDKMEVRLPGHTDVICRSKLRNSSVLRIAGAEAGPQSTELARQREPMRSPAEECGLTS